MVVATATHLELLVGESGTVSSEDREGVGGEGWRGRGRGGTDQRRWELIQ